MIIYVVFYRDTGAIPTDTNGIVYCGTDFKLACDMYKVMNERSGKRILVYENGVNVGMVDVFPKPCDYTEAFRPRE